MQLAPIPKNEKERLISLHKLGLLDTKPEERFDRITRLATKIFRVPISTLTLVDDKREWFKSCVGLPAREGERAISFCGHALLAEKVFVVQDTKKDKRFFDNPMVVKKPFIRFYAGVPIVSADGSRIGVFCIKDKKPRKFSKSDEEILKNLSAWAELEINSRNLSLALSEQEKLRKISVQLSKEKEEVAMNYEALFKNMFDGLAYCQMLFDQQGNPEDFIYLRTNEKFKKLTGLKDVEGKKVTEVIPGIKLSNPELRR